MSASPDDMDGLPDMMNSPTMGLAMGLLSAGGPSSTPVSLGQALGQGLQAEQQYSARGRESTLNYLQLLMALQRLQQQTSKQPTQMQQGTQ